MKYFIKPQTSKPHFVYFLGLFFKNGKNLIPENSDRKQMYSCFFRNFQTWWQQMLGLDFPQI